MKTRTAFKLAFYCLCLGVALGLYFGLRGRDRLPAGTSGPGAYADRSPGFDPKAAPPGALAVDFRDDVDPASVEAIGRALGVRFRPSSAWTERDRVYVGQVDPTREDEALAALRKDGRVETAEEDFTLSIPEDAPGSLTTPADEAIRDEVAPARGKDFPNDPRAAEQWHMEQIHMPAAWQSTAGEGVIVAVIDTGVSHVEDLAQTEFVPGWNFVGNNEDADDDHGHGTHVAGTIAQSTHNGLGVTGIAFKAKIMPLKVLSAGGSGSVAGIAQAVRWAADHGAKVINMSLGGPMNAQVLARAVKYAHDKGVVVVCAAGNDGRGRVSYPAANTGAVAVAATQQDEQTTFYSNWGKQVAIAAPGGNTREAPTGGVLQNTRYQGKDDYYFFMGTSMASPQATGAAALLLGAAKGGGDEDADPFTVTAAQLRQAIYSSARLLDTSRIQVFEQGNQSVFFLTVFMGFFGMILVFQAGVQALRVVPDLTLLGATFLQLLVRDLAASIGALMLATRVGAGIAAEVGSMVITEQVDALRMCGVEPVEYLLVPRFLASLLMTVVLWVVGVLAALAFGALTAYQSFHVVPSVFLDLSRVGPGDVITGAWKALAYGAAIPIVSGFCGLSARGGSEGVGRATTQAVVASSFVVIVIDFVISAIALFTLQAGG